MELLFIETEQKYCETLLLREKIYIYIRKEITPFLPFSFSNSNSLAISEKLIFSESFFSSSFFKYASFCHV